MVAWNLLLLATIVAAGLLTYGWLRELELPPGAAALGGSPALAPTDSRRAARTCSAGSPCPPARAPRLRALATRRRGPSAHLWGALAAAAIVSVPLSGQVHLALGAVPFAVYVAIRATPVAAAWASGGLAAAVGTGLAIYLAIVRGSAESEGRSLQEVGEYSASLWDLLSRWMPEQPGAVRLPRLAPARARRRGRGRSGGAAGGR